VWIHLIGHTEPACPHTQLFEAIARHYGVEVLRLAYDGIGISFTADGRHVTVEQILGDQSPAARAGIRSSDELLAVDGKEVATGSALQIASMLAGPVNTPVTLRLRRADKETINLSVKRAQVIFGEEFNAQSGGVCFSGWLGEESAVIDIRKQMNVDCKTEPIATSMFTRG
jgi:C-terminal processing protease CtpA/Prc